MLPSTAHPCFTDCSIISNNMKLCLLCLQRNSKNLSAPSSIPLPTPTQKAASTSGFSPKALRTSVKTTPHTATTAQQTTYIFSAQPSLGPKMTLCEFCKKVKHRSTSLHVCLVKCKTVSLFRGTNLQWNVTALELTCLAFCKCYRQLNDIIPQRDVFLENVLTVILLWLATICSMYIYFSFRKTFCKYLALLKVKKEKYLLCLFSSRWQIEI